MHIKTLALKKPKEHKKVLPSFEDISKTMKIEKTSDTENEPF